MPSPIAHVVGALPNFMKAAPVVRACSDLGLNQQLIHTGQHYDAALSTVFFDQLDLPEPDVYLEVGSGSHGRQTAAAMVALEEQFELLRPAACVVYGDINSTVAAALVASKMRIPIAHVEAGLRSFDRSMPEEVNRVLTDAVSDLLLITSPEAYWNLGREGVESEMVKFVGNTMIDTLKRGLDYLDAHPVDPPVDVDSRFALVTLHRPANVDDPRRLKEILHALSGLAAEIQCVFPVHPRGRTAIEASGGDEISGLQLIDPQGYLEFLTLQKASALVITDSGGIQEEAAVLGVPCLTVRPNTERPITISMGTNQLVEPADLIDAARSALTMEHSPSVPPLWDGSAGTRAGAALAAWLTTM